MPESQPFTLGESAVGMHEMYLGFKAAGFTRTEALYLVACMASGGPKQPPDEEDRKDA